jgi:hypothetical protein
MVKRRAVVLGWGASARAVSTLQSFEEGVRQDDGGSLRKPRQQKPQREVMSKMIDGKSSLESVGAAGVVIWRTAGQHLARGDFI